MPQRRNILFIHTDSMDGRYMGCVGHRAMRLATPNLDALAARGTLFSNAYANGVICVPSRASMFSGQFTHHCGGWNNYKGLEPGASTFKDRLTESGYRVITFGKEDYSSGQHTIRARVSPWTRSANILRPNYRPRMPRIVEDGAESLHHGDWADVQSVMATLEAQKTRGDAPFFLFMGIRAPHPPFVTTPRYLSRIDSTDIAIPGEDAQDHPAMNYQRVVKNWTHGYDEDVVRHVRHVYCAMISEVDAMVGQVLARLDALGLADSTTVIFSSDHGEMGMEHRQVYKMSLHEPSVHIPLIIAGSDVRRGATVSAPVSLVDIYPTLMDLAGAPKPEGLDGHSLLPAAQGASDSRPDWVFSECHDSSCCTGHFMVRRGDWKYMAFPGHAPLLFNLAEDPGELRDLAPSHPEKAAEMERLLRGVVDYEAFDAEVKAHDRCSFRQWRREQKAAGTYEAMMAKVFSGWDVSDAEVTPWTARDEAQIEAWLAQDR